MQQQIDAALQGLPPPLTSIEEAKLLVDKSGLPQAMEEMESDPAQDDGQPRKRHRLPDMPEVGRGSKQQRRRRGQE